MITLVVVPDADMRHYIRQGVQVLSPEARVIEAGDGIEALTLARAGAVDFVISDMALPRMDGPGLARAIQQDPELRHIPVLLVGDAPSSPDPGIGILPKPFNSRQLRDAIERSRPAGPTSSTHQA